MWSYTIPPHSAQPRQAKTLDAHRCQANKGALCARSRAAAQLCAFLPSTVLHGGCAEPQGQQQHCREAPKDRDGSCSRWSLFILFSSYSEEPPLQSDVQPPSCSAPSVSFVLLLHGRGAQEEAPPAPPVAAWFPSRASSMKIGHGHAGGQGESMGAVWDLGHVDPRRIIKQGMVTQG